MTLVFHTAEHEQAFKKALEKAGILSAGNVALEAPLYVLTAMTMFQKEENLEKVFNFEGKYFYADSLDDFRLSSGERILYALAINLFNGYVIEGVALAPHQAMGWLSHEYRKIYLSAVTYRYQ